METVIGSTNYIPVLGTIGDLKTIAQQIDPEHRPQRIILTKDGMD